ncbi:MAG: hypothetical protein H6714_00430 [Myxococcales bacterium]|nr:hypothetical protein [Myxococcales bacterium]
MLKALRKVVSDGDKVFTNVQGRSGTQAARRRERQGRGRANGASVFGLRDWLRAQEQTERERPFTKEELRQIRVLKRRVAQLEEEKEILKGATRLFVKEPQ